MKTLRMYFKTLTDEQSVISVPYAKSGITAQDAMDTMTAVINGDIFSNDLVSAVKADVVERTVQELV